MDFNYNGNTIQTSGGAIPTTKDTPMDVRTRVETYADIATIPNPYVTMRIIVKADETNNGEMTEYIVKSLKADSYGVANSVIDEVQRYKDFLGANGQGVDTNNFATKEELGLKADKTELHSHINKTVLDGITSTNVDNWNNKVDKVGGKTLTTNDYTNEEKTTLSNLKTVVGDTNSGLIKDVKDLKTNGVSQDNINSAIENYLRDHPVQSGATAEQVAQIEANRTAIGDSNGGLIKEVNDIKNTELQNLNAAIQTLETLVGVDETVGDKTGLPSGDANIIASINRIDSKTSSELTSPFKNKIANFLGDSQTEKNSHKTKIYYDWVKEILGLSVVNNYGIGGTTIAKKNASDNTAMCVRYANMDNNADLICVMGGVNDRWFNSQMGSFGDTDPLTFYGAMETLCNGLLTKYPGKTIIFITPTEQNHTTCNQANTTGYTPTDFANAMKRVCAKYSIPVFDANTCSGIYPLNVASASLYTTDRLHLNDKGHEVLGNKLSKFILNGANVVVINSGESGGESTSETYGNIIISKTATTINEGGTDTFTVNLDKAPTNSQIVNISSNNSDVTLSANTLTFNSNNYNQTQEVRINVAEDSDTTNDSCTLTLSSNNVPSKTITITVTDNDTPSETPPETPTGNQFVGKTVRVTKNYQGNFVHLTALLNVEDDMRSNSIYNIVLKGSNISNMADATNTGGALFGDDSGEVANGLSVGSPGRQATFTQTVSDGNLTITATPRDGAITTNYVKVPIVISGTVPYSFRINEIKIIVNNVERNILKLGSFFASDREAITIE